MICFLYRCEFVDSFLFLSLPSASLRRCSSSSAFLLFSLFVGKVLQTSFLPILIILIEFPSSAFPLSQKPLEDKRDKICLFIDEPIYTVRHSGKEKSFRLNLFLVILLSMRERGCKTLQLSIVYHKQRLVYKQLSLDINRRRRRGDGREFKFSFPVISLSSRWLKRWKRDGMPMVEKTKSSN